MKLYRILDTYTGKYFSHQWGHSWENVKFNNSGAFFKRSDTISKHLKHLVTWYEWQPSYVGAIRIRSWVPKYVSNERLDRFKVQITNVTVNSDELMESFVFMPKFSVPIVYESVTGVEE